MDHKEHFLSLIFAWIVFTFFLALYGMFDLWFVIALFVAFFLIDPDLDLLFGVGHHRNFITHSALFPILIYWALHPYLNMTTASELGFILFYPVVIHLVSDYYNFFKDLKGSALIVVFGRRLNDRWTRIYILVNIIGMVTYMIYIL